MTQRIRAGIVTAALLIGASLVTVWAIGRSSAAESEARTLAAMRDSVAFKAVRGYRKHRDSTGVLLTAYHVAERKRLMLRRVADTVLAATDATTRAQMAVLADSAATVPQLRGALYVQVQTTERIAAEFREYLRVSDSSHAAASRTIAAQSMALASADTAIDALTVARDQWKRAATCRVLGVRCPTRTQAFIGGALLTLGLVVAR